MISYIESFHFTYPPIHIESICTKIIIGVVSAKTNKSREKQHVVRLLPPHGSSHDATSYIKFFPLARCYHSYTKQQTIEN